MIHNTIVHFFSWIGKAFVRKGGQRVRFHLVSLQNKVHNMTTHTQPQSFQTSFFCM